MTQPNTFDRVIQSGNLIVTIAVLAVSGIVWNTVNIHDHGYRIDRLEAARIDDKKEVLAAITDLSAGVKELKGSFVDIKTDLAIMRDHDAATSAQVKTLVDRLEKR